MPYPRLFCKKRFFDLFTTDSCSLEWGLSCSLPDRKSVRGENEGILGTDTEQDGGISAERACSAPFPLKIPRRRVHFQDSLLSKSVEPIFCRGERVSHGSFLPLKWASLNLVSQLVGWGWRWVCGFGWRGGCQQRHRRMLGRGWARG
jgi:hypothetical protein